MFRRRPMSRPLLLIAVLSFLAVAVGGLPPTRAVAATAGNGGPQKYLGRWNYDQPDPTAGRNIARISCPASRTGCPDSGFSLQVPQIGDIVFSKGAGGEVVGHTDQGCVWTFRQAPHSLELDPPAQYCFNQLGNLAYTITRWSVTVSGPHERETIVARRHRPNVDYDFVLENGSRTRVGEKSGPGASRFVGSWTYDQADARSRLNIRVSRYPGPDGATQVVESPQRGMVTFARTHDHKLWQGRGTAANGHSWYAETPRTSTPWRRPATSRAQRSRSCSGRSQAMVRTRRPS